MGRHPHEQLPANALFLVVRIDRQVADVAVIATISPASQNSYKTVAIPGAPHQSRACIHFLNTLRISGWADQLGGIIKPVDLGYFRTAVIEVFNRHEVKI